MTENTKDAVVLTREQKLRAKYDTIVARIQKDTEAAAELASEINNIAFISSTTVGSAVVVKLGRKFADKDTTRYEAAVVLGVKEEEDGSKQFKVSYGIGFDAEIAVVPAGALSAPVAE